MKIDLKNIHHVYFIGIGGIGISAVARMMLGEGKKVSGQDMQESEITHALGRLGAQISIGQSLENIPKDADLIVYTIAIEYYDPELFKKLKDQPIPIRSYPEMLGLLSDGKYTIAVSGTHGKTTTTGMISEVLREATLDPTVIIGSLIADQSDPSGKGTNFFHGSSEYFVVEACEYRRSFLNINPTILVITNIDEDHLDYYKDIYDIQSAFRELALKVPKDGFVVCNPNDPYIADVVKDIPATIIDYGSLFDPNQKLSIPGIHNKKNAATAHAVAKIIGVSEDITRHALEIFPGTWRRFEYKGILKQGTKIYDDYAHHPHEITATLEGFRELYPKEQGWNITVVFQPHLFSRTKALLKDFGNSFKDADRVLVLPIYYAREEDDGTVSSRTLRDEILLHHTGDIQSFDDFAQAEIYLRSLSHGDKDIIVTMGAGEAFEIGESLLRN